MSGVSSAPERRWSIRGGYDGARHAEFVVSEPIQLEPFDEVEVIEVAAFDRVVAERDEAVRDGLEVANAIRAERDEARAERDDAARLAVSYRAERDEAKHLARELSAARDQYWDESIRLRELVEWINGGFVPGAGRKTYGDPDVFLDEVRSRTSAALAEGEQPEYGPGAMGVGVTCELDGDVHGSWCDHEGEQPAGEALHRRCNKHGVDYCPEPDCAAKRNALTGPAAGEQSDRTSMPREAREAAIRRAAETVRSGSGWVKRAGEQSTTETPAGPTEDERRRIAEAVYSDLYAFVTAGSYRIGPAVLRALDSVLGPAAPPSTTETATGPNRGTCDVHAWVGRDEGECCPDCGHEHDLLEAVLPAEGERRDELEGVVAAVLNAEDRPAAIYEIARQVIDALRSAAAPATPEGRNDG